MKLLFVDYDRSYCYKFKYAMGKFLQHLGIEVQIANSSQQAIELLLKNKYVVVITESIPDFIVRESPEEYLIRIQKEQIFSDRRHDFKLWSESKSNMKIYENEYTGVKVAQMAKEQGSYTIGLCPDPIIFKKFAGDNLDVVLQKPFDVLSFRLLIEQIIKQRSL